MRADCLIVASNELQCSAVLRLIVEMSRQSIGAGTTLGRARRRSRIAFRAGGLIGALRGKR
ncbi:hypothetical protein X946_5021 [Burkholderia sp. ABCPW 111]|nr:hypothetical protein X946_5021 [Burkholderia sp. ABCPW 111]